MIQANLLKQLTRYLCDAEIVRISNRKVCEIRNLLVYKTIQIRPEIYQSR
jgi:hypothetical protein